MHRRNVPDNHRGGRDPADATPDVDDGDDGATTTVSASGLRQSNIPTASSSVSWKASTYKRNASMSEMTTGTAVSRSSFGSSVASSGGGNIWTKMMGKEELWAGRLSGRDVFDDNNDDFDDNDSLMGGVEMEAGDVDHLKKMRRGMRRCGLSWCYEGRHFVDTVWRYPYILLISLATFGILCGVGIFAVNSERDAYIAKQKGTAKFVAMETAQWFSSEFRRAMIPLYSVQQGVIHSGYFDNLPEKIGAYPNLLIPSSEDTPFTKRNVTGICDQPDLVQKWRDIVQPINAENDLDGVVVGYRLFPMNVACLTEPHGQESTKHFKAEDFPQGEALLASDNVFGLDTSHSAFPLWKMITTDLFINKKFNIFGPFPMPPMSELICGHLAIWKDTTTGQLGTNRDLQGLTIDVQDALVAAGEPQLVEDNIFSGSAGASNSLNVHGTDVEGAWGFVVNFLDWTKMKDRSNIYERFEGCNLEFRLTRADGATVDGIDSALLAESPKSDMLDDTNSIVVETKSLHGTWQNRVGSLSGWNPPWYTAAMAGVILCSLILGLLTASTLVERQLHRNLLYKVMPRKAIAQLQRGQTVLEKFNLVTIFFSDIVGFTSMAGTMKPIQVMKMLNELYTELDKLVDKHQVYKVETIGDAYMVVGGAPDKVAAPLAAERVALFALDAIAFVKKFRTKNGDQIFIRAGIASGPTVAGVVGNAMPRYCFFGDTVNFASRMESTSKKMRIQCAEITAHLLQDAPSMTFGLTKRTEGDIIGIEVKGKGHQITYWVENARTRENEDNIIIFSSSDVETPSDPSDRSFNQHTPSGSNEPREATQDMHTNEEIYKAMTAQDWSFLGHAESPLVVATDDHKRMNQRAVALLEHHLDRVLKVRDPKAHISLSIKVQLSKFVDDVAATYNDAAAFHNWAHAIHVTTSMNKLLSVALTGNPLNSFSLVFSALLHDAGHTGMSNKILSDTNHALSEKFEKDVPIAERNSIDIGLAILFQPEYEALRMALIPNEMDKINFAKALFQCILITDIATPEHVKLGIRRYESSMSDDSDCDTALCPLAHYITDLFDGVGLDEDVKIRHPNEFIVTHEGLQHCVRNEHLMLLSDIAHLLQSWENFAKWNFRLYKELHACYKKGLCGNPRESWFQGQIGFFDKYIIPLAKRSKVYFHGDFSQRLVENGIANLNLWTVHGKQATEIIASAANSNEAETSVLRQLYGLPTN